MDAKTPAKHGDVWGSARVTITDLVMDSIYNTGGEDMTGIKKKLGLGQILGVIRLGGNAASVAYNIVYDNANNKLIVLTGAHAQVANATDLSAVTFRVAILGY